VYIARHAGGTFTNQFLGYEFLSRLASAPHGHVGPPGYHVLVSLAGWLPWTVLVPGAIVEMWQARRETRAGTVLLVWAFLPLLVLELVPGKLPHYALPCYVPIAIMVGRMWDVGLGGAPSQPQRIVLGIWAGIPIVLGAATVGGAIVLRREVWSLAAIVCGGTVMLGFAGVFRLALRNRLLSAWKAAVATTLAFHVLAGLWLLPSLEPDRLSRQIAEAANQLAGNEIPVIECGYAEPTMFFYLDRPTPPVEPEALPAPPFVLVAREAELDATGLRPDEHDPDWHVLRGFNYAASRSETVWVGRVTKLRPESR